MEVLRKLSRQYDVIRKVMFLSKVFEKNVAHSADSKSIPWIQGPRTLKLFLNKGKAITISNVILASPSFFKRTDYTVRI